MMDLDLSGPWLYFILALIFILPIIALFDLLKQEYKGRTRLLWLLIIVFLPIFGSILYLLMAKKYKKENP